MAWLGIAFLVLFCGLIGGYVYLVEYHDGSHERLSSSDDHPSTDSAR